YDGPVTLTDGTYSQYTYLTSGAFYDVNQLTPLGALYAASVIDGLTYDVTDKKIVDGVGPLLLDNIRDPSGAWAYNYNKVKDPVTGATLETWAWTCMINGVVLDDFSAPTTDGLNIYELNDGDEVVYYYGDTKLAGYSISDSIAQVKIKVNPGVIPTDWSIVLDGAKTQTVTKSYFENGLACAASSHQVFWTDDDDNVWGGVPLWLLVAMVDDDPDVGPDHFNLNDDLAAQHYEVKVISSDGWSAVFDSA